ncbi:MAG: hypothetical protein II665_04790, partial [Bacteroidales bacterium]|nr:hypothetical protein [Bacteroidales bacterium]
ARMYSTGTLFVTSSRKALMRVGKVEPKEDTFLLDAFDQSGLRPDNQRIGRRTGAAGRQRGPDGHGRHGGPGAKNREQLFHSQR